MATHSLPLLGRGMGGGHGHLRPSFSGREKTTQACWTMREKAVVSPGPILAALPKVQDQVPDIHAELLRPLMGHTRVELLQLGGLREPLVDRGGSVAIVAQLVAVRGLVVIDAQALRLVDQRTIREALGVLAALGGKGCRPGARVALRHIGGSLLRRGGVWSLSLHLASQGKKGKR